MRRLLICFVSAHIYLRAAGHETDEAKKEPTKDKKGETEQGEGTQDTVTTKAPTVDGKVSTVQGEGQCPGKKDDEVCLKISTAHLVEQLDRIVSAFAYAVGKYENKKTEAKEDTVDAGTPTGKKEVTEAPTAAANASMLQEQVQKAEDDVVEEVVNQLLFLKKDVQELRNVVGTAK